MLRLQMMGSHYVFLIVRNCISVPTLMHIIITSRFFSDVLLHRFDAIPRGGLDMFLYWMSPFRILSGNMLACLLQTVAVVFSRAFSAFSALAVSTSAAAELAAKKNANVWGVDPNLSVRATRLRCHWSLKRKGRWCVQLLSWSHFRRYWRCRRNHVFIPAVVYRVAEEKRRLHWQICL